MTTDTINKDGCFVLVKCSPSLDELDTKIISGCFTIPKGHTSGKQLVKMKTVFWETLTGDDFKVTVGKEGLTSSMEPAGIQTIAKYICLHRIWEVIAPLCLTLTWLLMERYARLWCPEFKQKRWKLERLQCYPWENWKRAQKTDTCRMTQSVILIHI